jgi:predicted Zn finger-like uncharacterized protein
MPTQVACPSCNQQLRVPDELIGRDVKCPKCATMFVGGVTNTPAAPPADSPTAGSEGIREERESRYAPPRDDDLDRPSRRPGPDLDDDLDDDDDDYRPRRRRRNFAPHRGGTILTFGIISLVGMIFCLPLAILGIPALIMGLSDLRAMREQRMDPDGRGMTIAGLVMGAVSTALLVVGAILVIVWIAAGP